MVEIFSVAIMPLIIIGTMLAIFGYNFAIIWAHDIYEFALIIATRITELPHANIQMPFMNNTVLMLWIIGLICLILVMKPDSKNWFLRNINYSLCGLCIILAIFVNIFTSQPLFFATGDHQLVAFNVNNKLQFNKSRASKHYFAFDTWYNLNNEQKPDKNIRFKCSKGICRYNTEKWNLVYMKDFTTIMNNIDTVCKDESVDYVVATFDINAPKCHAKILSDGLIIYPNGHVVRVINQRPWHNLH